MKDIEAILNKYYKALKSIEKEKQKKADEFNDLFKSLPSEMLLSEMLALEEVKKMRSEIRILNDVYTKILDSLKVFEIFMKNELTYKKKAAEISNPDIKPKL